MFITSYSPIYPFILKQEDKKPFELIEKERFQGLRQIDFPTCSFMSVRTTESFERLTVGVPRELFTSCFSPLTSV